MRRKVLTSVPGLVLALCLVSIDVSYAYEQNCSDTGYTVVFVNGILTDEESANDSLKLLQARLGRDLHGQTVSVLIGYNPSHLAGAGDFAQSVVQAFNGSVSDFDLKTILMQIAPEVRTRKILLVGHSQGTFYTNELYKYLVQHGVPQESIGVYNIATPASFVAGGGSYVTSSNDKVIGLIRNTESAGNVGLHTESYGALGSVVSSALRPNIIIPKEPGWNGDKWGGHHFSTYINGAPVRIIGDIRAQLGRLKAVDSGVDQCFEAPDATLGYKMQAAAFAAGDPLARPAMTAMWSAFNAYSTGVIGIAWAFAGAREILSPLLLGISADSRGQASAAALALSSESHVPAPQTKTIAETAVQQTTQKSPSSVFVPEPAPQPDAAPPPVPETPEGVPPSSPIPSQQLYQVTPSYGGGGGTTPDPGGASVAAVSAGPSLAIHTPNDQAALATTSVTVAGTADAGADVFLAVSGSSSATATTSADGAGAWSATFVLSEGTSTIAVSAGSASGVSATSTREVVIDTTAPGVPVVSVAECAASLVSGMCILPTTTATLAWSDASGASYYRAVQDGVPAATTVSATTSQVVLATTGTTTLAVVAYDAVGNAATSTSASIGVLSRPLIINEVGWGGFGVSAHDNLDADSQWIEIKNLTSYGIDLSHLSVERSGGSAISLSGSIPGSQYFVVGRSVPANETQTSAFNTSSAIIAFPELSTTTAEQLQLVWAGGSSTSTIDSTPAADACPGWCGGSVTAQIGSNESGKAGLYAPTSMERVSDSADGPLSGSWRSTDSYGGYIHGQGGGEWGTPGVANSLGLPEAGMYCGAVLTLLDVAAPGPDANPTGCTYLMRFITGDSNGAKRYAGLFRGDVGSSTRTTSHYLSVKLADGDTGDAPPADAQTGEHFFFAMWEDRAFSNTDDTTDFINYFTQSTASSTAGYHTPHGNYATVPFVYHP